MKAYTTRVGGGPFPTELNDATGEQLRQRGAEFGSVTGRPRRTGWLDLPALRYAVRVNGLDGLALTKMDVMTGLDDLYVCTEYEVKSATTASGSRTTRDFPHRRAGARRAGVHPHRRLEGGARRGKDAG